MQMATAKNDSKKADSAKVAKKRITRRASSTGNNASKKVSKQKQMPLDIKNTTEASSKTIKKTHIPSRVDEKLLVPPEEDVLSQKPTRTQIILAIHNKNKYINQLLGIYQEQLNAIGKRHTPDYQIMFDIMHYMSHYPDQFHHPRENILYKRLVAKHTQSRALIETLILEHESRAQKGRAILDLLKELKQKDNGDLRRRLSFRSEDYLLLHKSHVDLEENKVLPRVNEFLSKQDWEDICNNITLAKDPLFGRTVKKRYKRLNEHIAKRMETAADEFTLSGFAGMGSIMEGLNVLTSSSNKIGSIVLECGKLISETHLNSYKKLWRSKKISKRDLLTTPLDCMLDSYDVYTNALKDIGRVLRETRREIEEPYAAKMKIYRDAEKSAKHVS